jgi:hypothetical protein
MGSYVICTVRQILLGRLQKDDRTGTVARMGEKRIENSGGEISRLLGKLRLVGMMILKWILEK